MRSRDPGTGRFVARDAMLTDGMVNMLTGAGTSTDPRSYNRYIQRRLSDQEIIDSYRGGWVMRRLIDKPAREMIREWRNWQATPDEVSALEKAERKLGIRQKVERALQLAGLGGAGMILYTGGNQTAQAAPLDPTSVGKGGLKAVHVWHRSRFNLGPLITDWGSPWFGQPSYYETRLEGGGTIRFHPSRVIAFKGHAVPDASTVSWEDAFWGDSTVSVVLDAVQNVDTSLNGFAALIKDARNRRLSIPKLTQRLAVKSDEQNLSMRVQALAVGESMFGVTFLDGGDDEGKGGEKLDDRQMTWTGIPEIADMYMTAASGAGEMPATVLWGKSPDGMNATGESDLSIWEKTIKGKQDVEVRPCIDQFDAVFVPSTIGKQADADGVDWDWRPLSVMSEPEAAKAFSDFMVGFTALVNSNTVPTLAIEKLIQNKMAESAWFPGAEAVLEGLPEAERFPSLAMPAAPEPPDPANDPPPIPPKQETK